MYILQKPILKPEQNKTFNKLIKDLKLNMSLNVGYIIKSYFNCANLGIIFKNNLIDPVLGQLPPLQYNKKESQK